MASTYVNDLRLEEMATGDQSGTWGDTTNTNLELIAEAFSYGTQASFGSDADATTTIADGASDPARSLYLKVTSGVSLTATRTLTIAPNTVSKVWIIENATSGSQSISISQGSGANVTIPNGDVKVVYSDGAGSGAAVVDAFTDLNLSGTTTVAALDAGSGAITTTGTVTGNTLAGTLSTAAQPNITSVGTLTGFTSTGIDDNATSTAITIDSSENVGIGTTSPSAGIHLTKSSSNNYLRMDDGSNNLINFSADTSSAVIQVQGTGFSSWKPLELKAEYFVFKPEGTERMRIDSSGNVSIGTTSTTAPLRVKVATDANFAVQNTSSTVQLQGINDAANAFTTIDIAGNPIKFSANGSESMRIDSSGNVGIGGTPDEKLHVYGTLAVIEGLSGNAAKVSMRCNAGTESSEMLIGQGFQSGTDTTAFVYNRANNPIVFGTNNTERMRIDSSGRTLIGFTSAVGSETLLQVAANSASGGVVAFYDPDVSVSAGNVILQLTFTVDQDCTNGKFIQFSDGNTNCGSITAASATSVAYNTTSDERLKKNIVDASSQLDVIKDIKVREFDWKSSNKHDIGMIAQELYKVIPNVVTEGSDEHEMNWGVDYGKLTPYLVKAVQELSATVDELKTEINTLKGE